MYSGIIHHHGVVEAIKEVAGGGRRIRIDAPAIVGNLQSGSSINVDGICLTAVNIDQNGFWADLMPQTLELTTAHDWKIGQVVNIEPSLRVGDELGGHFVYGHVDGVAEIVEMKEIGNAVLVVLSVDPALRLFIIPQGSVALDGVSLTVANVEDETFAVSLIPETIERTVWKNRHVGDKVNFEADMLMKYVRATN